MPFALTLDYQPASLRRFQTRQVSYVQRLHDLASALAASLQTLWQGLLLDALMAVQQPAARAVVRDGTFFEIDALLQQIWESAVSQPARRLVPVLLHAPVTEAGARMAARVAEVSDVEAPFFPEETAIQNRVASYAGLQVSLIAGITLIALRQVLRAERQAAHSGTTQRRMVEQTMGLTPRQAASLQRRYAQLSADRPQAQVWREVGLAAAQGRLQRVRGIAQSHAWGSVNLGSQLALEQVAQVTGRGGQMRRYWRLGARPCPDCARLAQTYPEGVGLAESFVSAEGMVLHPPLHAGCQCIIDVAL